MELFIKNINNLVGKKCWGVCAGEGSGSIFSIYIGEKYRRNVPLSNNMISEDCQNYDAEYSFLVYSPWRVSNKTKILSASYFNNANDGSMVIGLKQLVGLQIQKVTCNDPCFDVKIEFENDIILDVFACDIEEDDCFYSFGTNDGYFSIGAESIIELME